MNLLRASRARRTLSPLIDPETSKITPTDTGESSSLKNVISCGCLSSNAEKAVLLRPDTYRPYVSVTVTVNVMRSVLVWMTGPSNSVPSSFGGGVGDCTAGATDLSGACDCFSCDVS